MSTWTQERARVAALSRSRTPDDPALVAARQSLKAERLIGTAEQIAAKSAEYPPLTAEQREAILAAFAGFKAGGALA